MKFKEAVGRLWFFFLLGLTCSCSTAPLPQPITHPPFGISQFNKYKLNLPPDVTVTGNLHCYRSNAGYLPVTSCKGEYCYLTTTEFDGSRVKRTVWPCKVLFLLPKPQEKLNENE